MAGTWTTQNKIIPSAYVNFQTNAPLSITVGERGVVALLLELGEGNTAKQIYTITATESDLETALSGINKTMVDHVLQNAKEVLIYALPTTHEDADVTESLEKLKLMDFDVIGYPYTTASNHATIATWVKSMNEEEGFGIVAVLPNYVADSEYVINVAQGIVLSDGITLTVAQTVPWVCGATAGASVAESNTAKIVTGAIEVSPRMTRTEQENAITAGKFIFKVDKAQNVSVLYDINSLTTYTNTKSKAFTKNRLVRLLANIREDISTVFESNYMGKINNNASGRSQFKSALVDYFKELERLEAIEDFSTDDIEISAGTDEDSVVVKVAINAVDSVEKLYMIVNLQ